MHNDIVRLRKKIDKVDDEIVELLTKRIDSGREIINAKIEKGMAKEDLKREKEIVKRLKKKYNSKLVDDVYSSIFDEVKS